MMRAATPLVQDGEPREIHYETQAFRHGRCDFGADVAGPDDGHADRSGGTAAVGHVAGGPALAYLNAAVMPSKMSPA